MTTAGQVTRRSPIPNAGADVRSLVPTRYGLIIVEHSTGVISGMTYGGFYLGGVRTKSSPDVATIGSDGNLWYGSGNESRIGRICLGFGFGL